MYIDNKIVHDLMNQASSNFAIFDGFAKAFSVLSRYDSIGCSISGGSDSDLILDICTKLDPNKKIRYVWFNTGMEYQATKNHLDFLEKKYGVAIERESPLKSIPACCREYGQPFLSKFVSEMMERLQRNDFQWEDEPYEVLCDRYPKCKSAVKWWCNARDIGNSGYSSFNINYNKFLKEFILQNPPQFRISSKCCTYAKKEASKRWVKENDIELMILGIRKSEGGIRSKIYKTCFSAREDKYDQYRPIFWYTNDDKVAYEELFGVTHSDCYRIWGMKRTGCVGCPYSIHLDEELAVIEQYEPKLLKAANFVFRDSYEYTRQYREFYRMMKEKEPNTRKIKSLQRKSLKLLED